MNWLGPLVVLVALYLVWHTFWTVLPLLVGIMVGIGLQERFPRLSSLIGDLIDNLRAPAPPAQTVTTNVRRRKSSTEA